MQPENVCPSQLAVGVFPLGVMKYSQLNPFYYPIAVACRNRKVVNGYPFGKPTLEILLFLLHCRALISA